MAAAVAEMFQLVLAELLHEERALGRLLEVPAGTPPAPAGAAAPPGRRRTSPRCSAPDLVAFHHDEQPLDRCSCSSRTLPRQAWRCSASTASGVKVLRPEVVLGRELLHEVLDEGGHVLGPLAQRRHADGDDGEAEVEVLAEVALLDGLLEVLVGGGDHAHVDLQRLLGADALDLALLQHAQDLGLGAQAHVPHLVEEDRALVGELELADLLLGGAGERALLVAEELALDQLLGDGRAVHLDEGLVLAQAVAVDGAGHQLLAHAALAR